MFTEVIFFLTKSLDNLSFEELIKKSKETLDRDVSILVKFELTIKKYGTIIAIDKEIDNIKILKTKYYNISTKKDKKQYRVKCKVKYNRGVE